MDHLSSLKGYKITKSGNSMTCQRTKTILGYKYTRSDEGRMETTWELHTAELHLITTLWEVNLAKRYMTIKITQEVYTGNKECNVN